jgi:flagellar basal body-associated protein FliL
MLFDPKHKKKLNIIWMVVCVVVILGMILLYMPALFSGNQ